MLQWRGWAGVLWETSECRRRTNTPHLGESGPVLTRSTRVRLQAQNDALKADIETATANLAALEAKGGKIKLLEFDT